MISLAGEDVAHGFGSFSLCRCCDMGIGIQSESGGEVAKHTGHDFDIHAVLQGKGGEGVNYVEGFCLRGN